MVVIKNGDYPGCGATEATKERRIFFAKIRLCGECRKKYKNKDCHTCRMYDKEFKEKFKYSEYISLKEVDRFEATLNLKIEQMEMF